MIAGLKPYAAYKDSGQSWLEDIPAHWDHLRAKFLFGEIDERSESGREELLSVSHITGVTPRSQKSITMFLAKSNVGHKVCRPGDVVINTMWAWMSALGVARHTGLVSPAYGVYRPLTNDRILPRYADHLLRTPTYAAEYLRRSTGVNPSRLRLYPEHFLKVVVVTPPLAEQVSIVKFLDYALRQVDAAIQVKRRTILLLNEQKQAIINRAVTRGFNSSAQFKHSGIPWLGSIPEHWEIRRLKTIGAKFGSGVTPRGGASVYLQSGIPLLRSQNIHFGELRLAKVAYISRQTHAEMSGTQVKPRDVLLNITGASIGRACAVPDDLQDANVNQHVCIIRPVQARCDAEYLSMFLATDVAQTCIYVAQNGSSREGLPITAVKALPIVLPPLEEQQLVRHRVNQDTKNVRDAISRFEREITLLREYRTRLIADVVTGKVDVREAAAKLPDTTVDLVAAPTDLPDDNEDLEEPLEEVA